jgi:hypothetical protein
LGITHSFACGQAYGATRKINNVQHSNFNPWHPTNFVTQLKRRLNQKYQKGQQTCPSQVWDSWSTEIRTLYGYSEKCTLAMGSLMGIQNSQGYAEAQRNIIEGCSRGGKIGGKIGGKMGDKSKKAAGGKNKPQHKEGEWYDAHCNNPDCVEKTADGKGKLGKFKVGGRVSQHRYKDLTGKEPVCGTYSIKV